VLFATRVAGQTGCASRRVRFDVSASGTPPATILLTTFDDDDAIAQGIAAGARGFREVAAGHRLLQPAVTARVRREIDELRPEFDHLEQPDPLTRREVEVLRLVAGGYADREIAQMLGTSEGTVKNHTSAILSKLGVRDRTRAVLRALERGYI
jgi:DNA-binding NarL/FixJ family response regulator